MPSDLNSINSKSLENPTLATQDVKNYCSRPFQQIAQTVLLSDFDFDNKSFRVSTSITLLIHDKKLNDIYIDIGEGKGI